MAVGLTIVLKENDFYQKNAQIDALLAANACQHNRFVLVKERASCRCISANKICSMTLGVITFRNTLTSYL